MHRLNSLRKAASVHNKDVRHHKMVKVSQRKRDLLNDMKSKSVQMPAPRAPRGRKRKSAMFGVTKKGKVKVRKSVGVKKKLAF